MIMNIMDYHIADVIIFMRMNLHTWKLLLIIIYSKKQNFQNAEDLPTEKLIFNLVFLFFIRGSSSHLPIMNPLYLIFYLFALSFLSSFLLSFSTPLFVFPSGIFLVRYLLILFFLFFIFYFLFFIFYFHFYFLFFIFYFLFFFFFSSFLLFFCSMFSFTS